MGKDEDEMLRRALREIGARGGRNRAKALTPARRREIAIKAAQARWPRRKKKDA